MQCMPTGCAAARIQPPAVRVGESCLNKMQAYLYRAQEVARAAEERTGFAAVTGLELRFQQ